MKKHIFEYLNPFELEMGGILPRFHVTYHTAGTYCPTKNNVIWACHTLTSNSNIMEWWSDLFGEGKLYDPKKHFIICASVLGSCYGSTYPLNADAAHMYHDFPVVSIKDMVRVHDLLRQSLGIERVHTIIGGSSGGKHALECAAMRPNLFDNVIPIAANARRSPWAIAFSETQRMAIEADATWKERHPKAGENGLKAARAIAMLSYRHHKTFDATQSEPNPEILRNFKAASYQSYQGEKFVERFDAFTYYKTTQAMDAYNIGRGRGGTIAALQSINANVLSIGIDTDIYFPSHEQGFIAEHTRNGTFELVSSIYGHDGFLIEAQKIAQVIKQFYDHHTTLEHQASRTAEQATA